MTTDRDRLAADIHGTETRPGKRATACPTDYALADRLIALGWTRPREPGVYPTAHGIDVVVDVAESASWVEDEFPDEVAYLIAHAPLDEERLARAIDGYQLPPEANRPTSYVEARRYVAAAIAKAYREDTDATD